MIHIVFAFSTLDPQTLLHRFYYELRMTGSREEKADEYSSRNIIGGGHSSIIVTFSSLQNYCSGSTAQRLVLPADG